MPQPKSGGSSSKSKKKPDNDGGSRFGIAGRFVKDIGDVLRKSPSAVLELSKELPAGLEVAMALQRGDVQPFIKQQKRVLGPQVKGAKNLASVEEWKQHPGYNFLTALGFLPIPGAVVGKAALATKAGRVKARAKKPPTRRLKAQDPKTGKQIIAEFPASRVPTTRAAQEISDKVRMRFPKWQQRKVAKGVARRQDIIGRLGDRPAPGIKQSIKDVKTAGVKGNQTVSRLGSQPVRELNSLVRALRLYRPGYIPPNWLGAQATRGIEQGVSTPVNAVKHLRIKKELKQKYPNDLDKIRNLHGEGISVAAVDSTGTGPIAHLSRGMGTTLGKVTDRGARDSNFFKVAADYGYRNADDIHRLITDPRSRRDLVQVVMRAEPASIKFSRTKPLPGYGTKLNKVDKALADNIFLYRWLTGSAGYTGRMLTEHPTLTAALANQGREAPGIEDMLEEFPKFMETYVPHGDKVSNLQAATLFGTPGEVFNLGERIAEDPRNAIDPLQPVQRSVGVAALGYDPFTGRELSYPSLRERAKFGFDTETRSIPWLQLGRINEPEEKREGRLFPLRNEDIIKRLLFGGPVPVPVNPDVASAMYRKEQAKKDKLKGIKRKRKRRRSESY